MIARFRHNYLLGQRGQDANAGLGYHQPRKKNQARAICKPINGSLYLRRTKNSDVLSRPDGSSRQVESLVQEYFDSLWPPTCRLCQPKRHETHGPRP